MSNIVSDGNPSPGAPTVERHSYGYPWSDRFPNAHRLAAGEGWVIYAAEADHAWWIITDEGTLADFLQGDDESALDGLIVVERFDDRAVWRERVDEIRRRERRQRAWWRFRGRAPYEGQRLTVSWRFADGRRARREVSLGQVWRHRDRDEVIVVESKDGVPVVDGDGNVSFGGVLDEFGLLDLGTTGCMGHATLQERYRLVSDPADPDLRWRPER